MQFSYEITPRPVELGGGWRLRLLEDGVGGRRRVPASQRRLRRREGRPAGCLRRCGERGLRLARLQGGMMDDQDKLGAMFAVMEEQQAAVQAAIAGMDQERKAMAAVIDS